MVGQQPRENDPTHLIMVMVYGCLVSWAMVEGWVITGAIALIGIAATWWYSAGRHIWRNHVMRKPYNGAFHGPDNRLTDRFYAAAGQTVTVPLRLTARLSYREDSLRIGIGGKNAPIIKSVGQDLFVKEWIAGENDGKPQIFLDSKDTLHIKKTVNRVKDRTYSIGLVIETQQPGKFELNVWSYTESGDYPIANRIWIVVTHAKPAISSKDQTR